VLDLGMRWERGGGGEWRGLGWAGFYGQRKPFSFRVKRIFDGQENDWLMV
jgi:hypothetical protein